MLSKNVQKIEAQEHTHTHAKSVFNWDIKGLPNFETILFCPVKLDSVSVASQVPLVVSGAQQVMSL